MNPQKVAAAEANKKGGQGCPALSGDHQRVLVLLYIARDRGPKSSSWLAKVMDVDACFAGALLDDLLAQKLVRMDGRKYRISLGGVAFLELNKVEV